jgi:hypothetical protein
MNKRWMFLGAITGIAMLGLWTLGGDLGRDPGSITGTPTQTLAGPSQDADEIATPTNASAKRQPTKPRAHSSFAVRGGTVQFDFNRATLEPLNLNFVARGAVEEAAQGRRVAFNIEASSTLRIEAPGGAFGKIVTGDVHTSGALLLDKPGDRVVIGNFAIGVDEDGRYHVKSTLNSELRDVVTFEMTSVMVDFVPITQELFVAAELSVAGSWASEVELPEAADADIGTLHIDARVVPTDTETATADESTQGNSCAQADRATGSIGSDVVVSDLQSVKYYGHVGDIHAYAVGTHACNYGGQRANWIANTNQHPVIVQNMYRLKNDRFEQIGMSWAKHGFYAVSWDFCDLGCPVGSDGTYLAVGCSDPYSAGLNGVQSNMSLRSEVNAHTGHFPYPWTAPEPEPVIGKRLQVHESDLDPNLNPDALYFIQGHYVHPNDAAAGTSDNNASYRRAEITEAEAGSFVVSPVETTQSEQPAIRAWQDTDPSVVETDIPVPSEGLFILAAKAIESDTGTWRYEYALQNLNSDRSGSSFSVRLPEGAVVNGIGFHDVDYHSGEIYEPTDWPAVVEDDAITWTMPGVYVPPPGTDTANALRFSTLYNFSFDANVEPAVTTITLGLFKLGEPPEVTAVTIGPKLALIDCNRNGIADQCDISCNANGCEWPCGGSIDCNTNGVPDECERDCNENGVADTCDILTCDGANWCNDCNGNLTLDACEPDCDGDGIPDDCVAPPDTDGDGQPDCRDLCPLTTPSGTCHCPEYGECCWQDGQFCLCCYTPLECISEPLNGVPECLAAPCLNGCILGDYDADGDLDLHDFWALQTGFSGPDDAPGYVPPPQEYWLIFDVDDDEDIDLDDYDSFEFFDCGPDAPPQYSCDAGP